VDLVEPNGRSRGIVLIWNLTSFKEFLIYFGVAFSNALRHYWGVWGLFQSVVSFEVIIRGEATDE
jgi:hypothetical protein